MSAISSYIQTKASQAIQGGKDAYHYVSSHKTFCASTLVALGAIAYLANQNQELQNQNQKLQMESNALGRKNINLQNTLNQIPKPNEWTLKGELNPTTTALFNTNVCDSISNSSRGDLSDPVTNLVYENGNMKISYRYAMSNATLSPLELLIHNNCQKDVQTKKADILDPNFSLDKLLNLIVAAAAARNTPLWNELMGTLESNNHAKNDLSKHLYDALDKSSRAARYDLAFPNLAYNRYGTIYDAASSLQQDLEGQNFFNELHNSSFMATFIETFVLEINDKLKEEAGKPSEGKLSIETQKKVQWISKNNQEMLLRLSKNYPEVEKYVLSVLK